MQRLFDKHQEPVISIPTGPKRSSANFLNEAGAQTPGVTNRRATDLGIKPVHRKMNLRGI